MIIDDIKNFDEELAQSVLREHEKIKFNKKIIVLASASKSRREIMEEAGIDFVVIKNTLDEENIKHSIINVESAKEYVKILSYKKAMTIAKYIENAVIISADTIAYYDGEKIEKPKDEEDAYRILRKLSSSTHDVITGVCIIDSERIENFTVTSKIKIKPIPEEKIEKMVKDRNTYLYAGGYCIDDNINGYAIFDNKDFNNIKGLPIEEIIKVIKL